MLSILRYTLIILTLALMACNSNEKKENSTTENDTIKVDKTLLELNSKIKNDTENDLLYIQRADYYLSTNKIDSALRDILIAINIDSKNANHFITLSDAYLAMGNPDKCLESLEKALQLEDKNQEALLKKAQLYFIMRDYEKCHATISQLLAIDKINPIAYFISAMALLEKADTLNAIKNLQTAVDQNQDYFEAQLQLGILFSNRKNPLAVSYLNNAIKLIPTSIEPYYQLGLFFQENGKTESAINTYNSILEIEPEYIPALYNLGYIYLVYDQDFRKASDYFSQVTQLAPDYLEARYNRGYCYELLGQNELARKDYAGILRSHGNFPKAIEGLNRLDNK